MNDIAIKDPQLSSGLLRALSDEEIEGYQIDGAYAVRGIVPLDWIEYMREAVDDVLADPGPFGHNFNDKDKPGRFFGDLFTWLSNDRFRRLVLDSPLVEMAASAMRSSSVNFFYDQLLVKEPGTDSRTPWHHDLPYWPLKGTQIVSIWLPLDPVSPDNGVVTYIKGSHRWGRWFRPEPFGTETPEEMPGYDEADFSFPDCEPIPDFDADADQYEFITWTLEPGDCILHHPLTVHGAPGNRTRDRRRRAIAMRYTGDDARFDPRPGTFTSYMPPPVGDPGIAAGDPLTCEVFPRIWPRAESAG